MLFRIFIFVLLNFLALGVGSLFTGPGVQSDWYQQLNKAPWTPPGWMFGAAWTTIMIAFALYMAYTWDAVDNRLNLIMLFVIQWLLNVSWNPVFFKYQSVLPALLLITALTLLMGFFTFNYISQLKLKTLFVIPYFLWLLIATSLNGYIYFNN